MLADCDDEHRFQVPFSSGVVSRLAQLINGEEKLTGGGFVESDPRDVDPDDRPFDAPTRFPVSLMGAWDFLMR